MLDAFFVEVFAQLVKSIAWVPLFSLGFVAVVSLVVSGALKK